MRQPDRAGRAHALGGLLTLAAASWLLSGAVAHAQDQPPAAEAAEEDVESEADAPKPAAPEAPAQDARDADIFGATPESDGDEAPDEEADSDEGRDADIFGAGADSATPAADTEAREAEVFGGGADPKESGSESAGTGRDQAMLGDPDASIDFSDAVAPNDPLTIGGLMYLRTQGFILQGQAAKNWRLSAPMLAQMYFDVRPNERVRGFMNLRLQFDPTLPASAELGLNAGAPIAPGGSSDGTQSLNSVFGTQTRKVNFVLDQLWINFDIKYKAFITVGKLHDRWGVGRFWMPTDYLHLTNRNPINVFDSRAGTNMVKVHVPVESLAWNFYGYAVIESPSEATNVLSRTGGALRAEFVLGNAELGLGMFARRGGKPRYAADLSFGLWDLDFYSEAAVRDASETERVGYAPDAPVPMASSVGGLEFLQGAVEARYPREDGSGMRAQAVGGVTYQRRYDDDDVFTLGAEYFYNGLGYKHDNRYPGLVLPRVPPLQNPATFFYLGEHYLALFASLPAPFHLDLHTFTLSTLGNLSDRSFISRLDYSYTLLTHLQLEAFLAVHYGRRYGEFRFAVDIDFPVDANPDKNVRIHQPPSLIDMGLALRLEF